ncbi:WD domain, G-beta repeat [Novymonas esmeraldas]|uniref:WD domain, G-beta repeat n=1 Tax=Novymonas esmeraldas TaxID=1808958 RepID=A0AAW0F0V9_9TRYP
MPGPSPPSSAAAPLSLPPPRLPAAPPPPPHGSTREAAVPPLAAVPTVPDIVVAVVPHGTDAYVHTSVVATPAPSSSHDVTTAASLLEEATSSPARAHASAPTPLPVPSLMPPLPTTPPAAVHAIVPAPLPVPVPTLTDTARVSAAPAPVPVHLSLDAPEHAAASSPPPLTQNVPEGTAISAAGRLYAVTSLLPEGEVRAAQTAAARVTESRPHPLRRQRGALEAPKSDLFSNGEASLSDGGSRTASVSSSAGDGRGAHDDSVFVGRTRRMGDPHAPANQRHRRRHDTAAEATVQRSVSRRRRERHHISHGSSSSAAAQRPAAVVHLYEAEDRSGPSSVSAASREKTSVTSLSTNALTPDAEEKRQRDRGDAQHRPRDNASATPAPLADPAGGGAAVDVVADTDAPLPFSSPAVQWRARCDARSANPKGPSKKAMNELARAVMLGSADLSERRGGADWDNASADVGDATAGGGAGGGGGERTVHFRVTGAFEDDRGRSAPPRRAGSSSDARGDDGGDSRRSSQLSSGGAVVVLTVRGMSPLHADTGVVHPFVRAWVVSGATGRSLVQATAAVPCAVTHPFDLRAHKTRAPWWNAQVALRLSPDLLRSAVNDALLLLEVLDFGNESIHGFPLLRRGLYPICWGFLMLRDCAGRSNLSAADDVHVQLYRFPSRTPWYLTWLSAVLPVSWAAAGAAMQPSDLALAFGHPGGSRQGGDSVANDVPAIYEIFANANNRKIPYDGGMVIGVRQSRNAAFVPETTDMLAYEEYLLSMLVAGGGSSAVPRSSRSISADATPPPPLGRAGDRAAASTAAVPANPWAAAAAAPQENYYRLDGERSLLPHDVLQATAVPGVVTCVSFSHGGSVVALGICRHLQYAVELRDPMLPDVPAVAHLVGHTGHIHRVVFQKEDSYLLSCSSDGTVRVWQPRGLNGIFSAESCAGPDGVHCVCTLPHGFPVYAAIFHQDKVVTGGFSDQLLVWDYEHTFESEMPSIPSTEDATLRLTATFTPEFNATTRSVDSLRQSRSTVPAVGELVHRIDAAGAAAAAAREGEPTITLSLASNERSNRAWSVHANGAVVCWRATGESGGRGGKEGGWEMSLRHRADCDGATEVEVRGAHAIVTCGSAPFVVVFDATTCEQLRVVNTRLPFTAPIHLLPDGETFAAAVGDSGRLLAWECFDGGLCTPATGYGKAAPNYTVARMAWAESQQLAVFVSRSPCSELEQLRHVQGPVAPAAGQSTTAFHCWQQEQQYRQCDMPSEATLLTIAGTVRRKATVIQTTDRHASDAFVAMFGGDVQPKRKAAYLAQRSRAIHQRAAERDTRNARLHPTALTSEPSALFATSAVANVPYEATEKGARMNAIVNFWRGLVSQHHHAEMDVELTEKAAAADTNNARPSTRRALRYVQDDDNEDNDDGGSV